MVAAADEAQNFGVGATSNFVAPQEGRPIRAHFTRDRYNDFYAAVANRVHEYLLTNPNGRFDNGTIFFKGVIYFFILVTCYFFLLLDNYSTYVTLVFTILFGVAIFLLAFNLGHDAVHRSLSPNRHLNYWTRILVFMLAGVDSRFWQIRHLNSHHVYPNLYGYDIDIEDNVFLRLSPHQPYRRVYKYQHLYAPFIYWILHIQTVYIMDFVYLFKDRICGATKLTHSPKEIFIFVANKVCHIGIVFGFPLAVMDRPWWHIAIGVLLLTLVMSIAFITILVGTHYCQETTFPLVGDKGEIPHSWAYHNMTTSLDWSPLSPSANLLVGGVNAHVAHHFFPNVAHCHYIQITKIIQSAAKEFDVPYHETTLPRMIASHFRFLKQMGQPS